MLHPLAVAAIVLAAALPAGAEPFKPKKSKIPEVDVDRAVERGVEWLKANGEKAPPGDGGNTSDALVFYTLYHGGLSSGDPVFQKYLKTIVDKDPAKTYGTALAAMCLSELDKTGYQWKLEHFAQFFVDTQCQSGQWWYGEPIQFEKKNITLSEAPPPVVASGPGGQAARPADIKGPLYGTQVRPDDAKGGKTGTRALPRIPVRQRRRGPPRGDNSNSQYAALGLRACAEAGIVIDPQCVTDALKWWEQEQCDDGGWSYGPKAVRGPWGSMTVGGIGAVAIYNWMLGRGWKSDPRVLGGFKWLNDHWDVARNPESEKFEKERWHYYYLYGLERAGMIVGTNFVGAHDWYDEGAAYLLKNQDAAGSWKADVWDTCFAILFLRRATKPLPQKVYSGPGQ